MALKDALSNIFWRKKELKQFVELTIENKALLGTIDWQKSSKYESSSILVDQLAKRQFIHYDDIL